mgnify:CR=1 FL=1
MESLTNNELPNILITSITGLFIYKAKYYELLQKVRDEQAWEEWILFMLKGIEVTAIETISLVEGVKKMMAEFKKDIRDNLPKYIHRIYSTIYFVTLTQK